MNPAILSPTSRFATPFPYAQPRSPSRSPSRQKFSMNHELDPLLSNLSPTSTLEALEATQAIDSEGKAGENALQESVAAASTSERALGIRAALAGKKLKEWYRELSDWPWPENLSSRNGFYPPVREKRGSEAPEIDHQARIDNFIFNQGSAGARENADEEEYWGSLPAVLVQDYEDRIDAIKDDMEALGVEDLKDYVRDAHLTSTSRRLSRTLQGNGGSSTDYVHLDDFTAVITATIMHALPIISRLNSLLVTWSVRLVILRQTPDFLTLLESTRLSMTAAWDVIGNADAIITRDGFELTRTTLQSSRMSLEKKIIELGRRLDAMLDILEGREETIPEEWIDGMESVEADFGNWVVETERMLMEEELKRDPNSRRITTQLGQESHNSEDKTEPVSHGPEELIHTNIEQAQPKADLPLENLDASQSDNIALPYSDGQVDDKARGDFGFSKSDAEIVNDDDTGVDLGDFSVLEGRDERQPRRKLLLNSVEANAVEKTTLESSLDLAISREHREGRSDGVDSKDFESLETTDYLDPNHDSLTVSLINASSRESFGPEHPWNALQTTTIEQSELHSSAEPISSSSTLSENPLTLIQNNGSQIQLVPSEEPAPSTTKLSEPLSILIKTQTRDSSPFPQNNQIRIESTDENKSTSVSELTEPLSILTEAPSQNISSSLQSSQSRIESTHEDEIPRSISIMPEPLSILTKLPFRDISPLSQNNQLQSVSTNENETTSTISKTVESLSISTNSLSRNISSSTQNSKSRIESTSEDETTPSVSNMSEPFSISRNLPSPGISDIQSMNKSQKSDTMIRPAPLLLKQLHSNMESDPSSDMSSDTSVPGSGTSEYFSNRSSPEIQQASMAEYFENPVEVTSPSKGPSTPVGAYSRRSSLFSERGDNGTHENGPGPNFVLNLNNRQRASSFAPEMSIPESPGYVEELPVHREKVKSHVRVRSASLRSFEVIPRHEV